MKKWMEKLIEQFDFDWNHQSPAPKTDHPGVPSKISEEIATILFLIDTYNKHLIEVDAHPIRKTRETLDDYAKQILNPANPDLPKTLFRFRQFFSSYRIDEYTYIQKTFDDFKKIIWDFVDELSEDLFYEQLQDEHIQKSLEELKEAVEANSIDLLRTNARQFIDTYIELHSKNEDRRTKRMESIQKNLHQVKKKLVEANHNMKTDHLTQAFNRKSFDEQIRQVHSLTRASRQPATLLMLDIDHFKKVNDNYGHDMGDFVLVELVKMLKEIFQRDADFVARLGGEEFCVLLPDYDLSKAVQKAEQTLNRVRSEVFVKDDMQLKFTISIGIAQLEVEESIEAWIKRADQALYFSKNNGRNRFSIAPHKKGIANVA